MKRRVAPYKTASMSRHGALKVVIDLESSAERDPGRFSRKKTVGAAFNDESVDVFGRDFSTHRTIAFDDAESEIGACRCEAVGSCKAGNTATDHDHVVPLCHPCILTQPSLPFSGLGSILAS